ncbi:MAG: alpha/beta hydrolase [Deltaproteobacteria bacterium]|nr:alpha/beta hydrolase [Deltaproteobacteria bacterium]
MFCRGRLSLVVALLAFSCACAGGPSDASTGSGSGGAGNGSAGGEASSSQSGGELSNLDALLAALRSDRYATLLAVSREGGWPAKVDDGWLVVSSDLARTMVAGDATDWMPMAMTLDEGFAWRVVDGATGSRYKLTDGASDWVADPWARALSYDDNGEMSHLSPPTMPHLERHLAVASHGLAPRAVRVWLPSQPAARVLYLHDGQNLFDPAAIGGGWHLAESAPDAMMLVGIDNTAARMDEYTHVADDLGDGPIGGAGDAYADFLHETVRALVTKHYGEPSIVGVMGSSLGGLVSLHVAHRYPGAYRFTGSMSGTLGWGSIGPQSHAETMIERLAATGLEGAVVYLDSGGDGPCADLDADGIDDDGDGTDNYCETKQVQAALVAKGYTDGVDLHHWHEPGAPHHESAWAARVWRPLELFGALP